MVNFALNDHADQIPEIRELGKKGLCDVRQGDCSTVQVFGQGFRNSYQLKCEFVKEKVLRPNSVEQKYGLLIHAFIYYLFKKPFKV